MKLYISLCHGDCVHLTAGKHVTGPSPTPTLVLPGSFHSHPQWVWSAPSQHLKTTSEISSSCQHSNEELSNTSPELIYNNYIILMISLVTFEICSLILPSFLIPLLPTVLVPTALLTTSCLRALVMPSFSLFDQPTPPWIEIFHNFIIYAFP